MPMLSLRLLCFLAIGCGPCLAASHNAFRLRIAKEALEISKSAADDSARWAKEAQHLSADSAHWAATAGRTSFDKELERVELSEKAFWTSQWHALEHEATQLQLALSGHHSNGLLQVHEKHVTQKHKKKHRGAKVVPASSAADAEAKIQGMVKGLAGKAALAPMLGMLKSLYQDQKKRIGSENKQEDISKQRFAKQQASYDEKVKEINDKLAHHKFSAEFAKNATDEYTRQFTYWQHVRERAHHQFHNTLKITHGMMQREKDMIAQYERALAVPDKASPASPASVTKVEAPEVVLQQQRSELKKFCQEVLMQVRSELGVQNSNAQVI